MKLEELDYTSPEEVAAALHYVARRAAQIGDEAFARLAEMVQPGDVAFQEAAARISEIAATTAK